MPRLLHVIANPKPLETSLSRQLAAHFFERRRSFYPDESHETLDLYWEDLPRLDAVTVEVFTKPPAHMTVAPGAAAASAVEGGGPASKGTKGVKGAKDRGDGPGEKTHDLRDVSWALQASDRYVAQFLRCDRLVVTAPMWNFGPPAILKAWIDLIVRQGHTFEFTPTGVRPLAVGKHMLLIGARGGIYSGASAFRDHDFFEPYMRKLFGFLGVENFEAVWAEGTTHPDSTEGRHSLEEARRRLACLAEVF